MKHFVVLRMLCALVIAAGILQTGAGYTPMPSAGASPLPNRSFFGMNMYITGLERSKDEKLALLSAGKDLGVRWSREEMSWANLEPYKKGDYNWAAYDPWIDTLVREGFNVIGSIQTSPNVTHFDYFQLKDKFNAGSGDLWGNMSIMDNDLQPKPAYTAYKVMTRQLEDTQFAGQGPLMRPVPNRWQTQFDRYHYRFSRGSTTVHVLWKIGGPEAVEAPVSQPGVTVLTHMGKRVEAPRRGNAISLTISEAPVYVVESPQVDMTLDPAVDRASPSGFKPSARFAHYWQSNGGLPLFGYAINGERLEKSPTDGKQYVTQWFERARFEYHPENAGTAYEVLLGLLGSELVWDRTFPILPPPEGVNAVCAKATKHCVWGGFLARWNDLGGVPIIGLPLSDQFEEKSTDGKVYTVQYFERARFEHHPENKPPHDVLLGLLGRQLYKP